MREMGITSVLIVTGRGHAGSFLELLGNGSEFGLSLSYEVQTEAGGIAQALALAENFIGNQEKFVVMLGDNIYENNLKDAFDAFLVSEEKGHVFLKEVVRPSSYGVPRFENGQIAEIIEKPSNPSSNYAVTGCYLYAREVFDFIKNLTPSARGELEISDVNDYYVKSGLMGYTVLDGFWGDCGESFEGMMDVSNYVMKTGL